MGGGRVRSMDDVACSLPTTWKNDESICCRVPWFLIVAHVFI